MIYHIVARSTWESLAPGSDYRAESLAKEGFIHCSTEEQVPFVLSKFFRGAPPLVRLAIDEARLGAELRWEESEPGRRFPHVYGPIERAAIVRVDALGG